MGLRNVRDLNDEKFYTDLPGGLLQAMGELFQGDIKLYVCPAIDTTTGKIVTPADFKVPAHLKHLYAHLMENKLVETIPVDDPLLKIYSRDVLDKIQSGDAAWEKMVPAPVVQMIKERRFFGCK
jgi:nicotinic acid mononucleotide adenylyltransferase